MLWNILYVFLKNWRLSKIALYVVSSVNHKMFNNVSRDAQQVSTYYDLNKFKHFVKKVIYYFFTGHSDKRPYSITFYARSNMPVIFKYIRIPCKLKRWLGGVGHSSRFVRRKYVSRSRMNNLNVDQW